ncbi:GPR1/FUN34/YaaH family transporter [Paenarthrobacter ilicis]|uniref:GPR1/FUN34/YaaH family transporter n=1 Tax=Paenarthrobacter ilicis TaxID=43665 RepID=UPI00300864FA
MSTPITVLAEASLREPELATGPSDNPAIAGLPGFVIGAVAVALQTSGYLSPAAGSVILPLIFGASAICTLLSAVWAARLGQNAVACIFGTFTGFWVSYAILSMSLLHGWLGIPTSDVPQALSAFLLSWLVVTLCLTVGSMRLPLAFTLTFILVDLHLVLSLVNVSTGSDIALRLASACAFAFAAIGVYLLVGAILEAGGGKGFSPGKPLLRS